MITPDSTLREIAAAAFEVGFSITITPAPTPTRADWMSAQYGPRGHCWKWYGPWRRVSHDYVHDDKIREGWERMFVRPVHLDDGTAVWANPKTGKPGGGYGDIGIYCLYDEPFDEPWAVPIS